MGVEEIHAEQKQSIRAGRRNTTFKIISAQSTQTILSKISASSIMLFKVVFIVITFWPLYLCGFQVSKDEDTRSSTSVYKNESSSFQRFTQDIQSL